MSSEESRTIKLLQQKSNNSRTARRKKLSVYPDCWFSSAFIVPIIYHSHNPYPKTMTLFFLNNWLIYKGRHGLLKCTTIKKLDFAMRLHHYYISFRSRTWHGSLLFLKTADIKWVMKSFILLYVIWRCSIFAVPVNWNMFVLSYISSCTSSPICCIFHRKLAGQS